MERLPAPPQPTRADHHVVCEPCGKLASLIARSLECRLENIQVVVSPSVCLEVDVAIVAWLPPRFFADRTPTQVCTVNVDVG